VLMVSSIAGVTGIGSSRATRGRAPRLSLRWGGRSHRRV
jgi:hypothetical protein